MSTIAEHLKLALHKSGITARELAVRLGVDESTVSLWLSGQRTPRIKNLQSVAGVFGVNVIELLAGPKSELGAAQQSVLADMADMPGHVQDAVAAVVSSIKVASETSLAPNNSFKPKPLRGSA